MNEDCFGLWPLTNRQSFSKSRYKIFFHSVWKEQGPGEFSLYLRLAPVHALRAHKNKSAYSQAVGNGIWSLSPQGHLFK